MAGVTGIDTNGISREFSCEKFALMGFTLPAGTEAAVDLGITVAANTTYVLTVCVDGAGTEARFYINGVYVGRQTSQMPAAVATGDRTIIVKSAGTTSRGACIANKTFLAIF